MQLRKLIVEAAFLNINSGFVRLTKEQARPRLHALRVIKPEMIKPDPKKDPVPSGYAADGIYEVTAPIQFKGGERLEYSGAADKGGGDLRDPEAEREAAARAARDLAAKIRGEVEGEYKQKLADAVEGMRKDLEQQVRAELEPKIRAEIEEQLKAKK